MRKFQIMTVLLCALALTAGAYAQADKPAPVLEQIPSGTMGYALVNSLEASAGRTDRFLEEIGAMEMLKNELPDGIMALIKKELKLGKGFVPAGGIAVTMLNPGDFGIDLPKLVEEMAGGKEPGKDVKLPFVIIVPSKDVESAIGGIPNVKTAPEGNFTKVTVDAEHDLYAIANTKGYVFFSPNTKALTAVLEAKANATNELTKDQAEAIKQSDIAVHVNMKVSGPIFRKLLVIAQKEMKKAPDRELQAFGTALQTYFALADKVIDQFQGLTLSGRYVKDAVLVDALVAFAPGSELAKMNKAGKPRTAQELLGRLPNINWILAVGSVNLWDTKSELFKLYQQAQREGFAAGAAAADSDPNNPLKSISKETIDKLLKLNEDSYSQVTVSQFVVGGAPPNSGLFSAGLVLEGASSDKLKALLAESSATIEQLFKEMGKDQPQLQKLQLVYKKSEDASGLDEIQVKHPEIDDMPEMAKAMMSVVLGDDQIRVLVGVPDAKSVAVTFGGGKVFMDETLKIAKTAKGTIANDKDFVVALEHMPKNLLALVAFNGANLVDVIKNGMNAMGAGGAPLPINITTRIPVMIGAGQKDNAQQMSIYVPTALVKDIVKMVLEEQRKAMERWGGAAGTTVVPDGDF